MKKILFLMGMLLFTCVLNAQTAAEKKVTWDYPVKPGMEEWSRLKTEKERIAVVQVPEDVLAKLSSEEIVRLCISFPLFGYYTAFNTPQEGFQVMLSRFNIFRRLLSKKDAGRKIIAEYKDAGMSGFNKRPYSNDFWTIKLDYLELILSQKEILQFLTLDEKIELLSESRKKFSEKMADASFSSLPVLQSSARIMMNALKVEEYQELKSSPGRQAIEKFAETGMTGDMSTVNEIIRITDNYLNNFNNKNHSK